MYKLKDASKEELIDGVIIKSVSGTFVTETEFGLIDCKARGIFRKDGITPLAGDVVRLIRVSETEGVITFICDRKNEILRPPAANLDLIVFVCSVCEPETNFYLLDKFLAVAFKKQIQTLIAVTKTDIQKTPKFRNIYADITEVLEIDYSDNSGVGELRERIRGKTVLFTGNSGVGKTTLLNHLCDGINAETGEISKKLGRGRHTTRTVEFYKNKDGGYIADTPGFSTFETDKYTDFDKRDLPFYFPEFLPYLGQCVYADCSHIKETDCAVTKAVNKGIIPFSRYESYIKMYNELGEKKRKFF
jgi:ribosome biogenesis GTPase